MEPSPFSADRIVTAMLTLHHDDPWDGASQFVLDQIDRELAKYQLEEPAALVEDWHASAMRRELCAAEKALRENPHRERSGLEPWGMLVASIGMTALTDDDGNSPLHWAAEDGGAWHALPERVLTIAALLQSNLAGMTPFELAARSHTLEEIEPELLRKIVGTLDRSGKTLLHYAAQAGYLMLLPPDLKTNDFLGLEDSAGRTVYEVHRAALRHTPQLAGV